MNSFVRALRTPELRAKILFTLGLIAVYRLGVFIPTPGFDATNVMMCADQAASGQGANVLGMVNMFSGGALLQLSIFSLGVMPYITASIIVQLLRVVIPRFEALHKEGASGTAKLTQYTRYLTIGLGVLQATTIITLVRSGNFFVGCTLELVPDQSIPTLLLMVMTMTVGTVLIMFMGEMITERGVGNGMSLMIFSSIAASFPASFGQVWQLKGWITFSLVMLVGLLIMVGMVFVEQSQRRIPVQYAKKVVGRKMYGGQSTFLPVKVAMSGVMPVIFASAILSIPQFIQFFWNPSEGFGRALLDAFSSSGWLYVVLYFFLILMFAYFYMSIQYNPLEMANNLRQNNGTIPGIRPGKPTADFIAKILSKVTLIGALFLAFVALVPIIYTNVTGMYGLSMGGTSIIIIVGVALETVKQLESQMMLRHYKGFLD